MKAGELYGRVPNVLADKLIITTVSAPGSGSTPALLSNLLSSVFNTEENTEFVVAGARIVPEDAVTVGTDDSEMVKVLAAGEEYSPPVANWVSHTYIRASDTGPSEVTVELFLSQVSRNYGV